MSVTHASAHFVATPTHGFAERHPQFTPFLLAVAIVAVSIVAALAVTGLPA